MTVGQKLRLSGSIWVQIASLPDREHVVWELWVGDCNVAEVAFEGGELTLEIWGPPEQREIRVSLDEILKALTDAKEDLTRT